MDIVTIIKEAIKKAARIEILLENTPILAELINNLTVSTSDCPLFDPWESVFASLSNASRHFLLKLPNFRLIAELYERRDL